MPIPLILIYGLIFLPAFAQLTTFNPPAQDGITYSVNVPQSTASSGSGPIFFQLKSTRGIQWFAWGQGSQMFGSNIFVVYASQEGDNITVSPRLGLQHIEPRFNPDAQISVLAGSGIENGVTTANIRCDTCINWSGGSMRPNSSSSSWVWAVKYGSSIDSNSLSASITIHDASGVADLDLRQASGGMSDNPFITSSNITSSSGQAVTTSSTGNIDSLRAAHAVIMTLVFIVLFPFFALMIHIFSSPKLVNFHAALQLFTLALAVAGLGIGIKMAKELDLILSYHPIVGMIVIAYLALFQPTFGFLQHIYFRKHQKKSALSYLHRWVGRCMIILGVINGGLGFHLSGIGAPFAPTGGVIAYSVVAGIVGLSYVLVVTLLPRRSRTQRATIETRSTG
ncbi:uncharacterized protein N7482_010561 [Penicillium canariense]|uniref:Cytochrome b561 domain-containing protein n=1 Tax=Penicillium canariense TaxID=189055 RepID=A0A9W9HLS4_9EURO|nr:uncharacterized protein N7482_010561 [Penicillium canariense]KAJ5151309.1 hypothetical protein N7482_010561 [Penicillium canariense]